MLDERTKSPRNARFRPWRKRGGFSLLEVLVATVIAVTFLTALYTSFVQFMRTSAETQARLEALRNARSAISTLADEIKAISRSGNDFLVVGLNETAGFGNSIDDDHDGRVDEEIVNGFDDDGDWVPETDDLHARIVGPIEIFDRFTYTVKGQYGALYGLNQDDLGDFHVDEDHLFGRDSIVFRVFPSTTVPNFLLRTITYAIGDFEGQRNVLVRQVRTEFTGQPAVVSTAPLAFGALGLDLLFWDPNANPNPGAIRQFRPDWSETWNSTNSANFDPPRLPLPASVFIRVTVFADSRPYETYVDGAQVETMYMQTVVNIEDTIGDAFYPRPTL